MSIKKVIQSELKSTEAYHYASKIADKSVKVAGCLNKSETLEHVSTALNAINSSFSIYKAVTGIKPLVVNLKKRNLKGTELAINSLEVVRGVVGLVSGSMAFLKVLDIFKLINIADDLTKPMGKIPVIGPSLSVIFTFGNVSASVGIIRSVTEIGISALKIYETDKKISHTKNKVNLWTAPIDKHFVQDRIEHIQGKQEALLLEKQAANKVFTEINQRVKEKNNSITNKKDKLKIKRGPAQIITWAKLRKNKKELKKLNKKKNKKEAEVKAIEKKHAVQASKIESWVKIKKGIKKGQLKEADFKDLKTRKITKWTIRKKNLNHTKLLLWVKLAIQCATLAIAVITLVFSTMTAPPGTMLALSAISLGLTVATAAHYLYKKHHKPHTFNLDGKTPTSILDFKAA